MEITQIPEDGTFGQLRILAPLRDRLQQQPISQSCDPDDLFRSFEQNSNPDYAEGGGERPPQAP